jgi:hypothetical protein
MIPSQDLTFSFPQTDPRFIAGTAIGMSQLDAGGQASTYEPVLRCTEAGCDQTFRRSGDYRRHMMKHRTPPFRCIMVDCSYTFYRLDKLRDHIKQGHKKKL